MFTLEELHCVGTIAHNGFVDGETVEHPFVCKRLESVLFRCLLWRMKHDLSINICIHK